MIKEKRFAYILGKLQEQQEVGFAQLSTDLNVSEDTIRRDIDALNNNGLLMKIRGGAIPRSHNPLTFKERIGYLRDDKEVIALKAQPLVKSGQTIFLDGGTSVYTLVSLLATDIKLTVITNNTAIIPALSAYANVKLIILGGTYFKESETIVGLQAINMVKNFQADLYFMGICALDTQRGVTASFLEEAELKQAMLQHSGTAVALSTFEKLETYETYRVCAIEDLDYIITEVDAADEKFDAFKQVGVKIL
ncbi:DeoR/GlpR family DNA-binding transcription regulator [Dyadobacter chenwenxiniae]|uniref:DeoR/GlpR family DNA-binding transcription regulator n=1 Tax=Dyadobacter chenwenxiniae TaxID=2906456 RepID=A0A9X1PK77_9BACT|nr:DeoR/GlpR family DNA-binding transcription regulator [Dyadobacter chenwenxiniae]MCF0060276.1 DeoR/GlpR family DNA-binding transcription regulator [Dyadobacter chenwenxiniae]UON86014.1 DeoR/GlpR family DNA-binding transcription regulator [Dyadobacter chenwenxiniae]